MGYAREAALATLQHGERTFGLARVAAITSPGNVPSIRLLESIGFRVRADDAPDARRPGHEFLPARNARRMRPRRPAPYAAITGWGDCIPPAVLTNADLATFLDTDDAWIVSRTGIRERRDRMCRGSSSPHRVAARAGLEAWPPPRST